MDRPEEARAAYDSARVILEEKVQEFPENAQLRSVLGLAHAGLSRKEEALREGRKGVELMPISRDAWIAPSRILDLAKIYTMIGDHEAALDELERLAAMQSEFVSPAWLRVEPWADPLRKNSRFQKLLDDAS
jgi:tetratricopeptide (TPR) repeat protein